MNRYRIWIAGLVILIGGVILRAGHQAPIQRTKIDVSKLGPQVGERVPDISLVDQDGKRQTLETIMGPKGAMLVFIRSADW
jgi:hypothetical protein